MQKGNALWLPVRGPLPKYEPTGLPIAAYSQFPPDLSKCHERLFYNFDLEAHLPGNHMLHQIDQILDKDGKRTQLQPFCRKIGRPSIDPELILRKLVIGELQHIAWLEAGHHVSRSI